MTKAERELIDQLKMESVMVTERICQLEAFISAGQKIPYSMVQNSSLLMRSLAQDFEKLLLQHGEGVKHDQD